MNLSRVLNPQNPVSTARRLKSWNIEHNFKWNQPCLSHVSNLSRGLNSLNSASGFLKLILLKTNHEENVKIERCYCSTFWPRSSSSFDFVHTFQKIKFILLYLRNSGTFVLFYSSPMRRVICLKTDSIFPAIYSSLSDLRPNLKNLSSGLNLGRGSNILWFHLKWYSLFQDSSRRSIETGFWWI